MLTDFTLSAKITSFLCLFTKCFIRFTFLSMPSTNLYPFSLKSCIY
nr:MAG TPA: hypothetical protein [Caudoviricetes sp.]